MAKFEGYEEITGQYGPFLRVNFDGRTYSLFKKDDFAFVRSLKVGDNVNFDSQKKGNYDQITRFEGRAPAGSPPPASSGSGSPSSTFSKTPYKRDPEEFNYMMATSYAKDFIIGSGNDQGKYRMAPKDAVKLVVELFREVGEIHKGGDGESK